MGGRGSRIGWPILSVGVGARSSGCVGLSVVLWRGSRESGADVALGRRPADRGRQFSGRERPSAPVGLDDVRLKIAPAGGRCLATVDWPAGAA